LNIHTILCIPVILAVRCTAAIFFEKNGSKSICLKKNKLNESFIKELAKRYKRLEIFNPEKYIIFRVKKLLYKLNRKLFLPEIKVYKEYKVTPTIL
jgi:hypothetical protein